MNFETIINLPVTTDLIEGHAIQHLAEFDKEYVTITNVLKAHGTLTYGKSSPTMILSNAKILRELVSKVHPKQRPQAWDSPYMRGFKMRGSLWWTSLIPEMDDGWIVLLNEDRPMNPSRNGCYRIGDKR